MKNYLKKKNLDDWARVELIDYCKMQNLKSSGNKNKLKTRIRAHNDKNKL